MSLTRRRTEFEEDPFDCSAVGHRCFFCGEFLTDPAVLWHGFHNGSGNIYLHGECVIAWLPRLMRDALELKYMGRSCWNQLVGPLPETERPAVMHLRQGHDSASH